MRVRPALVATLLLLPAIASAQVAGRRPPLVGRGPDTPAPLPPHAPGVRDLRHYTASQFAFESYPTLSLVQTDRYVTESGPATYLMQGQGIRIEWRVKPTFAVATDITSAFFGGPFTLHTAELGGRYRPRLDTDGARPFFDIRASWAYSYNSYGQPYGDSFVVQPDYFYESGQITGGGLGALIGTGFETPISRSLTLSAGMSLSSYRMGSVRISGRSMGPDFDYQTTVVRLSFGVTYNRHRLVSY